MTDQSIPFDNNSATIQCSKCGLHKLPEQFYKRTGRPRGRVSKCKDCKREHEHSRWIGGHKAQSQQPEQKRKQSDAFLRYRNSLKGQQMLFRARLQREYGLTVEEYDLMIANQGNKCAICATDFATHFRKPSIDHCHKSGKVRGILCSPCNTAIGQLKDDPEIVEKALAYLRSHKI